MSLNKKIRNTGGERCVRASTSALFRRLSLLSIPELYKLRLGEFKYEACNGRSALLVDFLLDAQWQHNYDTRQLSLRLPFCRTSVNKTHFVGNALKIWGCIPGHIKNMKSLRQFKRRYFEFLING